MADAVFHHPRHGFLYFMNPGIAIFINPAAGCTYNMVVLLKQIGFLKLRNVFSELMLDNQTAVEQQIHSVIESCPAYAVIVVLHVDIQLLHIEMTVLPVYFVEYGKPLRSLPMSLAFNVFRKDLLDGCLDVVDVHKLRIFNFFHSFNRINSLNLAQVEYEVINVLSIMYI